MTALGQPVHLDRKALLTHLLTHHSGRRESLKEWTADELAEWHRDDHAIYGEREPLQVPADHAHEDRL